MVKDLRKESSLATSFLDSFPKRISRIHNENYQMTSSVNDMQKVAKYSPGAFHNWLNIWHGNKHLQQIFKKNHLYRYDITTPDQKTINSYANQVNKVANSNSASLKTATVHNYHIVNSIAGLNDIYSHASNQATSFNQASSYVNSHNLSSVNSWLNSHPKITSDMYLCTKSQASLLVDKDYRANSMAYSMVKNHGITNKKLLPNSSAYQAKKSEVAKLPKNAISPISGIKALNLSEIRSSVNQITTNNQRLVDSLKPELVSTSSTVQNIGSQVASQSASATSASSSVDLTKINTEPLKNTFNTARPFWKQMKQAESNLSSSKTDSNANLMSINSDLYLTSSAKVSNGNTKPKSNVKSSVINHNYNDVAMTHLNKALQGNTKDAKQITNSVEHKYVNNKIAMNYLHYNCGIDPKIINYMTNRGLIRGIKGNKNTPPKIEFVKRAPRNQNEANHYTTQDYHLKNSTLHDIHLENSSYKTHQGSQEEKVVGANYIDLKPTKNSYTDKSGKHAIYTTDKSIQAGQKSYGFNFRLHNGKDKLYVFTSPQDTLGYLQTHLNDHKGLNNATFVSFNKNVNAGDIQKFINHQYPRRGQFNKIILCPPNSPQGYQMVQRITSQFGNRSKYVNNRAEHQKLIETEVPMSENRHYNDMVLRKPNGFNETWVNQLRCQTMHNHNFERPSMHLDLNQYSLMNAQQAMLNMSRQDSGRFDTISHLYSQISQNEHKGIEKVDAKNPRINMIQKLEQKMKPQARRSLKRYMNYSGYYLSANEMSKYTAKAFQKKYMDANHPNPTNKSLNDFNVREALKKPYNLNKLQLNTNQIMNTEKDTRNKRLYATAMNATASMWKRRIILFYHNKKRGRATYQKEHSRKIEPLNLKTVRKYIKQIKIADVIREKSYERLNNKKMDKFTPDLKKLSLVANKQAKPKITGADAINDIKITHDINKYMAKHQLKPYSASDVLGNKLQQMINNKPKHSPLAKRKAPVPYLLRKVSPNDRKNYVGVIKNFDRFLKSNNSKQGEHYLQKGRVCYTAMTSNKDKERISNLHLTNMTRQRFDRLMTGLGINKDEIKKSTTESSSVQQVSSKASNVANQSSNKASSSNSSSIDNNDIKSQAQAVYDISKDSGSNKSMSSQANNVQSTSTGSNSSQKPKVYTKADIAKHAKNYVPDKANIEHAGYYILKAFKVQPKYWKLTAKATRIFSHSYQVKKPDDKKKDYKNITKLLSKIPKAERNKSRQAVGCIKNFNNRQIYVDSITQFTKHALDPKFTIKNNKNIHRFQSNRSYNATVRRHLSPKNNNKSHSKNQLRYHGQSRPRL